MNLHGDGGRRNANDLADRRCVELFQVADDDLAIQRLERMDHRIEPAKIAVAHRRILDRRLVQSRSAIQFIECDQLGTGETECAPDVRRSRVVSDSIYPGSYRTPTV